MRELFELRLGNVNSLDRVAVEVVEVLQQVRRTPNDLVYVSGLISSEGLVKMPSNIRRLSAFTHRIRSAVNPVPTFSATDIFSDDLYERIDNTDKPGPEQFEVFWRKVLK